MKRLTSSDHVVVVGAGLAGWRFVEALRREGYDGALSLLGDERDAPYDRPPLSKKVLVGKWDLGKTTLATPELVKKNNVDMRLGVSATRLDVASTTVYLDDDTSVQGTHVVIATGTRARHLTFGADDKIHYLRRLEDVTRINDDLATLVPDSAVGVIGGGFIGAETATALRTRGFHPIVLEVARRPLLGVLGEQVSTWLLGLARSAGVELRVEQMIRDVVESAGGFTISFDDGSELKVGTVLAGVGVTTNVEWLASSGLEVDNGVVVDEHFLVTERVAAIGDVARFAWPSVSGTELVRIEHWEVANGHASALAQYWTSAKEPTAMMVPYFWSDQYGQKIQLLGHPRADDEVVRVLGSDDHAKWLALYGRHGIVTGAVTLNSPRALMLSKVLLERPTTTEEAISLAPWAR
jgi:3-phenylpropionate/trans-cinnamate dioxygenase ferredoxin reductase subunit